MTERQENVNNKKQKLKAKFLSKKFNGSLLNVHTLKTIELIKG